jgi:hypothetical protein
LDATNRFRRRFERVLGCVIEPFLGNPDDLDHFLDHVITVDNLAFGLEITVADFSLSDPLGAGIELLIKQRIRPADDRMLPPSMNDHRFPEAHESKSGLSMQRDELGGFDIVQALHLPDHEFTVHGHLYLVST